MDLKKLIEEAGQRYEPPYDSPIEDILAYNVVKYIRADARLQPQVEAPTPAGTFRLDFVFRADGVSVALECDGEEFHDPWRDEWRDALILGSRDLDDILRIPGKAISGRMNICLLHIAEWFPVFFSERGRANIETLARSEALAIDEAYGHPHGQIDLGTDAGRRTMLSMVRIERRSDSVGYLAKLLAFAEQSSFTTLDDIIEDYKSTTNWST